MYAQPDATDNHLELHNAFVVRAIRYTDRASVVLTSRQVDPVVDYVDWAASKGFGVMDVNVPAAFPNEEVRTPMLMKGQIWTQNPDNHLGYRPLRAEVRRQVLRGPAPRANLLPMGQLH